MKSYHEYADDAWPELKIQVRKRKRINQAKKLAGISVVILLTLGLFQVFSPEGSPSPQMAETPEPVQDPIEPSIVPSDFVLSDDEALDKLADLGPILVELDDGTKRIILTRPNKISGPTAGRF